MPGFLAQNLMIRAPMMAAITLLLCGAAMGAVTLYAIQDKPEAEPPSGESIRLRKREVFSRPVEVAISPQICEQNALVWLGEDGHYCAAQAVR